jgi:septal ring factor EnvC (AmiA/AmiB activator)
MNPGTRALIVLVVASLGAWGCAQGPANGPTSAERIRALENKISRLEDDFRTAVVVRDQLKKKVSTLEEEKVQQIDRLQAVVKERDDLKQQLASRTNERDNLQVQFDQFRKGIKTLLGQAEVALTAARPVSSVAATPPVPGKS